MKITKYQITETNEALTILLPPSKEKGTFSIIMMAASLIGGSIMELGALYEFFPIDPATRIATSILLLAVAFVGLNDIYYLQRGHEYVEFNKRSRIAYFYNKGFYSFRKKECFLGYITYLGVQHPNNEYAFTEVVPHSKGRVANRNDKATMIISKTTPNITDGDDLEEDILFGYGIEPQDAAVIGQRISKYLGRK